MAIRKDPKEIAARMAEQRERRNAAHKVNAFSRQPRIEDIYRDPIRAINPDNRRIDLKIRQVGDWKIRIGLNREIAKKMGLGFHEGDPIPKETTWIETDAYHAVRLLGHIVEGHDEERVKIEELLKKVDDFHSKLYTHGDILPEKELNEILGIVQEVIEIVSKKESGYKILAEWKLEIVPELILDSIKEKHPFSKRNKISAACNALMAFKERYGAWRVRQTHGIDSHDLLRQKVLKRIRNERLKETLRELAQKLMGSGGIGVGPTLIADWAIIEKLRDKAIDNLTLGKGKLDKALEIIADCGHEIKAEWLKKELREVYKYVLNGSRKHNPNGWREKARYKVEQFARLLGQRNTFYILAELNESKETDMNEVITHIERCNTLLLKADEEENFKIGKRGMLFSKAGSELRLAANAIPKESD